MNKKDMLKAVILDDEPRGCMLLEHKLRQFSNEIELVATFHDPVVALAELAAYRPDILFLDVEMPVINGFQFLELLAKFDFEVVFTTAYDAYTLEALRVSAADYLLKPIDADDLASAIERLKRRAHFTRAKAATSPREFAAKRLPIYTAEGIHFVDKTHIVRVEAMSNYCTFFLIEGKKIVVSKTLKEFEPSLAEEVFIRVNRSSIVNIHYIERYRKGNGGILQMTDGTEIVVSPQRKEQLMVLLFGT